MTQKKQILRYIDYFGSITPMQAFADLGITKLATRISEMKKDGWQFETKTVHGKTRYGKKTQYACYSNPIEKRDNDG